MKKTKSANSNLHNAKKAKNDEFYVDDCGELADRDSYFCRQLHYHYGEEK